MKRRYFLISIISCLLCFALTLSKLHAQSVTEVSWLNKHISAIQSIKAGSGFEDLQALNDMVANARIVALGECTHGSREVFQLKHRLLEYLVSQKGFTVFAIESDFAFSQLLNEYVQTGRADSATLQYATGFAGWNTKEVWEMIEWIRSYNQIYPTKIQYIGIDMQNPFPTLLNLKHFAEQQSDSTLTNQLFALFQEHHSIKHSWEKIPANSKHQILSLSEQIEKKVKATGAPDPVYQNARVLLQLAQMLQSKWPFGDLRDQAMASNVEQILQENPSAKVVLWAHNGHIAKTGISSKPMGYFLDQKFGSAYVSIGFATGKGSFSTVDSNRTLNRNNQLTEPIANSYEAWFSQAKETNFILPLNTIGEITKENKWLTQQKWFRIIGATLTSANPRHQFLWHRALKELFDALIYLHQTSASQPYSHTG